MDIKGLVRNSWASRFVRFSLVGAVWTAFNIGSDVLLVDHFGLPGWLGTLIGYVILYIGRYYNYLWFRVIQPQFWKYVYSTVAFTLAMWVLKILAIDVMAYPAIYASPVITASGFFLKYFFYKSINLMRTDQ